MLESNPKPEWIDLARADDPRDVVYRAVACLAQGGIIALPTETAYALAASALHPSAVSGLLEIKRVDPDAARPMPLAIRGPGELTDWVPEASIVADRLARRSWPGPVTLVARGGVERGLSSRLPSDVRRRVVSEGRIGLRCPAHPLLRDILEFVPAPLVLTGARTEGSSPASTTERLAEVAGLSMVLDAGPIEPGESSTVVQVGADDWAILRPGRVPADEIAGRTGVVLLFICTGNTCRSPMAAALCRARLAERLGCTPEELGHRGIQVISAGIGATEGMPPATHAAEVVRSMGATLEEHTSRRVTAEMAMGADWVIAMTRGHREAILNYLPELADRVRLLHAHGDDIEDPIGADLETYRETALAIEENLSTLLDQLGIGSRA